MAGTATGQEEAPVPVRLPLALAQGAALLGLMLGAGAALQTASDAELLGLHKANFVPVGNAVDAVIGSAPSLDQPAAPRSWRLLPLAALHLGLLWDSAPCWGADSPYASLDGYLSGQIVTLLTCLLTVLPAVLSAWLLSLPLAWTPIALFLSLVIAPLSIISSLFWVSALPMLPKARLQPQCARAAVRRFVIHLGGLATFYGTVGAYGDDSTFASILNSGLEAIVNGMLEEVRTLSETGSAATLAAQFAIALLGICVVIEHGK